jgi:hypothetical protein
MKVMPPSLPTALCLLGFAASSAVAQGPGPGGREGRPGGGPPPSPVVQALDTDGDGELSAKEIENAAVALRTLDKDKDGKLSAEEIRPAFGGGRGMGFGGGNPEELVTRMMAFDKNGDGKLGRDELPERMQGLMDRADANKDGFVDKAELTALAARQSQRGPGAREGSGRPEGRGEGGPGPRGGRGETPKDQPRKRDVT